MTTHQNQSDPSLPIAEPLAVQSEAPAEPWGFWATIGMTLTVLAVMALVQTLVSIPFIFREHAADSRLSNQTSVHNLMHNGLLLAIATCATAVVCTSLTCLFAGLRRGYSVKSYLGLYVPPARVWLTWGGTLVVYLVLSDVVTYLSGRQIVPDFMIQTYKTAGFLPLFLFALIVAAPVFEETLFRGFALPGLQRSWMGPVGAMILTSSLWAIIHLQYDLFQIAQIFLMGLIFGTARIRSNSVLLTMGLHAIANFAGTAELFVVLARGDV